MFKYNAMVEGSASEVRNLGPYVVCCLLPGRPQEYYFKPKLTHL